ncbi:hypothetical protein cypCar_00034814, partial [Cyprinus carpio]
MLEGLVAWVLNTYLGKYVSNLNTDQLSIALLKGAVELENLPLRKDALRGFDLPFEVKAGVIGKITLQIPFYRPHSDPWVICMSQLNLIIGPAPPQEYDEVREREAEREQKKQLLKALEDKWKSECEQKGESYWYSVVTRIVENIELKIQGVHLRFEDDFSNPEKPCAFGVCIKNVSAQNCKEPAQKLIRQKELEIGEFSVYWDTECTMLGDLPSTEVQEMMSKYTQSHEHQYIFEPVCASVLVRRNASKESLRSSNTPRIEGKVQLEPLSLRLSQVQYQQMMAFLKELDRREREMLFRKWRPKHPICGNCRQWWMFAVNANLNEIREQRRQRSWDFALHRARDAKLYTSLYFQRLKGVTLSPQEESLLKPMTNETPASSPSGTIPKSGSSGMIQYLQSWFPGWGGWYGGSERGPDGQLVSDDLLSGTAQWEILAETDDLFDPLEDSQTLNTFTRKDHLFARLDFILEKAAVTLYHQDKMKPLLNESGVIQLEFSGVKIRVESLPRSESSLLTVKLGGLFLRDLTTQGSIFPVLVSPKPDKVAVAISQPFGQTNCTEMSNLSSDADSSAPPVFEMIYERNPIRSKFERRLEVNTSPLNIIYNPQAIKKVAEFFYKGRVHTSGFGYQSELELRVAEAARRQYNKLKMQTKAEIRQTIDQLLVGEFIENSKHWTMKLDICAPQVIFPDDFQSEDPMLVVVDLGRILLTNYEEDHKTNPETSQTDGESDEEFQTPLATPPGTPLPEKEIMVGHYKDNWKHLQDSEVGPTHVVEKFNVLLQLEQRLRYTSDPQFPGAVLSGTLPDLKVHINLEKMTALRSCLARLVHGLYLVDTLQTYGSDFDLLVASHKHLSFDVPTGSLRESQPTSPVSPDGKSPELQGLHRDSADLDFDKASPWGSPLRDQEALIKLEYHFVSSDCPSMNLDRSLQVTSMQVNNLDIILNPETIVELLKFLQQSFPQDENSPTQQLPPLPNGEDDEESYQSTFVPNKELTVEIHRLNLLLLRTVTTGTVLGGEKKGMKIATASINGTKVNVSMGSRLDVNGSLGCIQLVDLTQEGGRSQFVVSIGSVEDSSSTDGVAFFSIAGMAPSEALSFRFMEKSQGECSLQLRMASLHYNHSAKFLKELSLSANEVEDNFRSVLKTAATKVSTVLATKTAEYSGMVSLFENPYRRSRRQSQCNWTLDPFEEDDFCVAEEEPGLDSFMVKLTLDVSIESPVVSIPRKPGHPELLVGHLGSIRIQNFVTGHDSEGEKLQVEVKDIRLYSVNTSNLILRKGAQLNSNATSGPSPSHGGNINLNEPQFTRHDFFEYLSRGKAFHILKDATIKLTVEKVPVDENLYFTFSSEEPYQSTGLMKVDGRFVDAVQVCLCKPVYEQVLQTLDNLSFIEDPRVMPSQHPTPPPPTPSSTKLHRFPDLQATRPLQNESPPLQPHSFTQVKAIFRVSELQVQLSGDLNQGCQGLVSLRFQDLEGDFTKDHPHSVSIQLALHSLLMEDLLEQNPESKYKHLMVSRGAPKPSTFSPKEYLSQSCPTTSNVLYAEMPRSLPAQFEEAQNVFQFYQRHPSTPSASSRKSKKDAECPGTPPPSPSRHTPSPHPQPDFDDSLVHINVLMVDRRHPEFKTRYGSIGRSVDVDFNCLDILITLQTWVMILDFFGIGSTANNHAVKVPTTTPQPEHSLENSTLNDLGDLYTEIEERVNTKLDLKVRVRPQRAARVLLDIEAGAPVLLIPESSRSKRLIVANLGQLRVRNHFLPAGTRGTFSLRDKDRVKDAQSASDAGTTSGFTLGRPQPGLECIPEADVPSSPEDNVCLLDCIALDLQEMDIFAAEWLPCEPWDSVGKHLETDLIFPSYAVRRSGEALLKERCHLKLKVERNLDKELSHAVPDMSIHGSLSSVHCSLDLERYQLIRGLLEHNLGEPVEEFLRPYNLQDPSTYTVLSGDVYTSLSLLVDMKDVRLELLDNSESTGHNRSLARFDFMKSKLLFENFSNSSKSVNLVSHSLLAHDTRFTGSSGPTKGKRNVFECILQPSRTSANRASLQLELHYRSTQESSCFTVILNNLRVFLIFDWLQLVRDFLHMPAEKGAAPSHQRWPSGSSDQGGTGAVMPKTVKSGVVTKRSTVPVTQDKYLEVKINVTGTEFVVVEDSSSLDTNAIILKGTTVLTYKPRLLDRPFSGSLAGVEVFSCRLGSEQETALSIIDPVNVQLELCGSPTYQSSSGLLDAFNIEDFPPLLEIQFPALDIRLSYNDVQLFLAIAKSIPTTGSTGPSDTATEAESSASTASTDTPSKSKDSFRQKTE